ncbi:uncharacterized protein LOC143818363 [Ranitomeya variabilis]|uniref:uncharacterized protein LOC143818363 n=1 Tax=Ranitomeya variabilis TaxID=490064 RepID=UPI0040569129
MDDWDNATSHIRKDFLKTRWRSMKDCFNKDLRQEIQVLSGAAARIGKYKYHRLLAFLRPVLAQRITCSSTLKPGSSSGVVPHRTAMDQSQPSTSEAASGSASQAGEQAAGPSGPLPLVLGSSCQWQKASDRSLMPEFIRLRSVFQNGLKALGHRLESGLTHINTLFQDVNQRLNRLEADLQKPAHHFFNKIEQGMSEHLTPELQLNVMQTCNAAYVQAMQQTRYYHQAQVVFPPLPPITHLTSQ